MYLYITHFARKGDLFKMKEEKPAKVSYFKLFRCISHTFSKKNLKQGEKCKIFVVGSVSKYRFRKCYNLSISKDFLICLGFSYC